MFRDRHVAIRPLRARRAGSFDQGADGWQLLPAINHILATCQHIGIPWRPEMEASARSMWPHTGYEGLSANHLVSRKNDLTRKGQAALDLIDQIADTISATENCLEGRLLQTLDQLKAAEDRNGVLTVRATEAESRASEAVKWLRRLYDE